MSLVTALSALRDQLHAVREGADLADQIDDYLIPRLNRLDAPLLAVIGGSTGAGKSTITNTLVGEEVSQAGILRPTTRSPILLYNQADQEWFTSQGVLAELPRTTEDRGTGVSLHMVAHPAIPAGFGLIDAPDVDSFDTANHELAAQLLGAADLWIFTTTAARYGDAVPWIFLDQAAKRGVAIAVVINRIPPGEARAVVESDLGRLLAEHGLDQIPVFAMEEQPDAQGLISEQVAPLKDWLWQLVASDTARRATIIQTLAGVLGSIPDRVEEAAATLDTLAAQRDRLDGLAHKEYLDAVEQIIAQSGRGLALKTEVVDRFAEHVGTSSWMDRLQRTAGRWRDNLMGMFTKDNSPEAIAAQEIEGGLTLLIAQALLDSHGRIQQAWALTDALPALPDLDPTPLNREVEEMVAAWRADLLTLVRKEAEGKVGLARGLSIGINAAGIALMLAVFSTTGGITGGEVAVAGGTAAVGQAMLSAIFGDQAVRSLVKQASADLRTRVHAMAMTHYQRAITLLDVLPTTAMSEALRTAAQTVSRESQLVLTATGGES